MIDPIFATDDYLPRTNYQISISNAELQKRLPVNSWGTSYVDLYRIAFRRRLNVKQERTLIGAIIAPYTLHTNLLNSIEFKNTENLVLFAGYVASLPFDFLIKSLGKGDLYDDQEIPDEEMDKKAKSFGIKFKITSAATDAQAPEYRKCTCSDKTGRIAIDNIEKLTDEWEKSYSIQTDYERYINLVELDVLCCMTFGITLNELKVMYRIQFPVLQAYSADTWYDTNGRIVFTNNRSMSGIGFGRKEWENGIKGSPSGKKFYRTITDDSTPGDPVERTIEYVAPFDRCDREQDYETAWKFFEDKYRKR